jgi:aspartate/methionine/tyrosine aminotransferase
MANWSLRTKIYYRLKKDEFVSKKLLDKIDFSKIEFLMFVLDELADELAKNGRDVIKLTLGKAQEELHPDIIKVYIDAIKDTHKRSLVYPEGLPELRVKIAEWYTLLGNFVDPKSVLINTGTSPFFKDLFRLLIEEGDEILLPQPYYSVYYVCGLLAGANIKFYNVDSETFRIDMDDFRNKYDSKKTKFIVTCSPGNPYGNIISSEEYQQILSLTSNYTYIIADEIYRNTGFSGRVASILDLDLSDDEKERIIVTNSFSKGFRMYTARVGFSILPNQLLEPYRVLLQHTLLTTNPVEQFACVEALNHLDEVEKLTKIYKTRNDYMVKQFANCRDVDVISADGGFYLVMMCDKFMKTHNFATSFELAKDLLEKSGVAVVPGSDFGVPNGVRVSFTHLRFCDGVDRMLEYFSK